MGGKMSERKGHQQECRKRMGIKKDGITQGKDGEDGKKVKKIKEQEEARFNEKCAPKILNTFF